MSGRIRAEDIAQVRERTRIDEIIGEHVTLRSAGAGSLKGLCPFHDERSPSFHVTPAKGLYHCFGCQAGGDAIAFLMELQGLSFAEAVERLAGRAGVQLRYEEGGAAPNRISGQRARLLKANAAAAQFFTEQWAAPAGAPARELMARRGFDEEACSRFGVGFAPTGWDGLTQRLRRGGYDDETLQAAGLVIQGNRGIYDRFRGRIVWPIKDLTGDIVGFGARRMDDAENSPKYLNTPETLAYKKSQVLYGIDMARRTISKTQQVVVVEGYTDVMAAHLAGVTNAVATCGTAFGADHVGILRRLLLDDTSGRGEVVFTFDSDEAGRNAALRAYASDQQFLTATYVAVEPNGLDPADLRLQRGDQAVRDLVAGRVPLFEFALRSAVAGVDVGTAEGRLAGLRRALPIIAAIKDQALRPEYARMLSGWLGLPERTVTDAVAQHRRSAGRAAPQGARQGSARDLPRGLERDVLRGALHLPAAAGPWLESVEASAFDVAAYRGAYEVLLAVGGPETEESEALWWERVQEAAPDDERRRLLRCLAVEPMPILDSSGGRRRRGRRGGALRGVPHGAPARSRRGPKAGYPGRATVPAGGVRLRCDPPGTAEPVPGHCRPAAAAAADHRGRGGFMSPRFRRRAPMPDDVRALQEEYGSALGWGRARGGAPVVGTMAALVVGADPPQVLPWHLVDRALWEPPTMIVHFREARSGVARTLRLELEEHGELPPVIRTRVTRSVVTSRRVALPGDAGAVLAARRDAEGSVTWTVVFDAGVDPSDPDLQQAAREALEEFRQSLGV